MDQIRQAMAALTAYIGENGVDDLDDEEMDALISTLSNVYDRITEASMRMRENQINQASETPPPDSARLLWILSGSNPEAFVQYLTTFPDQELRSLLQNPTRLEGIIQNLSREIPPGQVPPINGIDKAPLNSSNIWGFKFDPKTNRLLVRFQSGSVYGYSNVPQSVFNVFANGAIPARTSGRNRHGQWWRGKNPSLGAAFYSLIRQGNYPYSRLS